MKLDRNIGRPDGKYALILNRKLDEIRAQNPSQSLPPDITMALAVLRGAGVIDDGPKGSPGEFFVIRLRDKYAPAALHCYSMEAEADDMEYGREVLELASRAGRHSPFCKRPD